MTLVQTEPKSIKIGTTAIKKVTIRPNGTEKQIRPEIPDYLCFTANTANSTVKLTKTGSPTAVTLETSTDGTTWTDYTIGRAITLANVGDKVYMRNKSETTTRFSTSSYNYYQFKMTGSIAASGDITYLINKNGTDTLNGDRTFASLFAQCTSLISTPQLPATTLADYCYYTMFYGCTNITTATSLPATSIPAYAYYGMFQECSNLEQLPSLPATVVLEQGYGNMFASCTKIKLSTTQAGEYQTAYNIPNVTTVGGNWNYGTFAATGGPFKGNPTINTTYYTSNQVI